MRDVIVSLVNISRYKKILDALLCQYLKKSNNV